MSGTTLRILITLVLLVHGVGHVMGTMPALGLLDDERRSGQGWLKNWSSRSWLLTDLLGDTAARVVCVILYGAALIGFLGAALGLAGWLVPHDWWRTLVVVSAGISLVAIALYWNALILLFPHKVGALAVNVATLVCLLVLNWPTEADIGY
jgi:hypothetical protein